MSSKWFLPVISLLFAAVWAACSSTVEPSQIDALNDRAYEMHYRNLDSTQYYARQALTASQAYSSGHAEALNHLAFVDIAHMDYAHAKLLLDSIPLITNSTLELFVATVQQMRICQRCSENRLFYDNMERAEAYRKRIREDMDLLTPRQQARMTYAESEYYIVLSTYYYYMGLETEGAEALSHIGDVDNLTSDTAQYVAYLYNYGAGGSITDGTEEDIARQELHLLARCYQLSREHRYTYWRGNALQAISEHLLSPHLRKQLLADAPTIKGLLGATDVPDSLLAGQLATMSLDIFAGYGDVYQTAGAYRTLARCYQQIGDNRRAVSLLHDALDADTLIQQAPDLIASIYEQLSVIHAALQHKSQSDHYRNLYLDLVGRTQTDKAQEAMVEQLAKENRSRNVIIFLLGGILLVGVCFLWYKIIRIIRHRSRLQQGERLTEALRSWIALRRQTQHQWQEKQELLKEEQQSGQQQLHNNGMKYLEQRAKISLATATTPLIDRILVEYQRSGERLEPEQREYIVELTKKIDDYNQTLTQWIQMQQGMLNLRIESFAMQQLFDIMLQNRVSFQLKGVSLEVHPTAAWVKADPILTLFMLNTMADNALRYTPNGGHIVLEANEKGDCVEVTVADDGCGMSEEQCASLFKLTPSLSQTADDGSHHGFGLLNCRGIIEKYKKLSSVFNVCSIGCTSQPDEGSRFHFRLPKGIRRALSVLCLLLMSVAVPARQHTPQPTTPSQWADSAYFANVNGHYEEALRCTETARRGINADYLKQHPEAADTLLADGPLSTIPPEVEWLHRHIDAPYDILLDIRNEAAVAALALQQWNVYQYNNRVYTLLYKEVHADHTLMEQFNTMQRALTRKNTTIVILTLLIIALLWITFRYYYRYLRMQKRNKAQLNRLLSIVESQADDSQKLQRIAATATTTLPADLQSEINEAVATLRFLEQQTATLQDQLTIEQDKMKHLDYENHRLHITNSVLDNCLSTLKHETMYFPARIRQMAENDTEPVREEYNLTQYYKTLHSLLSSQAQQQLQNTPLPHPKQLLGMLLEQLQHIAGERLSHTLRDAADGNYCELLFTLPTASLPAVPLPHLFDPDRQINQSFLLCRQIVRDIGDATNQGGCGIRAEKPDATHYTIIVTLPRKLANTVN